MDYKLDRTAFKRQAAEEADDQLDYWLSQPPQERLRAAIRLNAIAWNFPPGTGSEGSVTLWLPSVGRTESLGLLDTVQVSKALL